MMRNRLFKIVSIFGHLLAVLGLGVAFYPLAKYYYDSFPPMGSDFYQFTNFAVFLKNNLSFIVTSWKPIWFSGHPTYFDYGLIHSYALLPLLDFFSPANASKIYLLIASGLYLVICYFLFLLLSKNRLVAFFLAIIVGWTPNLYVSLFGGGTNGFSATQVFFPLTLLFLVKYFQSQKTKDLLLGSLVLGLSFWGHGGLAMSVSTICVFILIVFRRDESIQLFNLKKFKELLIFFVPAFCLAGFALYPVLFPMLYWSSGVYISDIQRFYPEALSNFYYSNNLFLFVSLGFIFLFNLFFKKWVVLKNSFAFLVLTGYFFLFQLLFIIGKNPAGNSMSPERTYFALTLILACLIASWSRRLNEEKHEGKTYLGQAVLIMILSIGLVTSFLGQDYLKTKNSFAASVPTNINDVLVGNNLSEISKIIPAWLNPQEQNFRFYEIEYGVNTWWHILFKMPMVKGCYYTGTSQWTANWLYWADLSLIGEAVTTMKVPEPIAKNNALFLIDWYGIKYWDNLPAPYGIAPYLSSIPGFLKNTSEEKAVIQMTELNDQYTSPIVRPINVSNLLFVGDNSSYDVILRILGMENLNSQYLIPIHGPEILDKIQKDDLASYDAIYLYNYQYEKRQVWKMLEDYVKNGGKLIIETGTEVKESDFKNTPEVNELPSVFPVKKTIRQEQGEKWNFGTNEDEILKEVNLNKFSPLIYENTPWKLSTTEVSEVKPWGKIILSQNNKPVLVTGNLGRGKVVWSGMNLPYHIQTYLNYEESRLVRNIIGSLIDIEKKETPAFSLERVRPENIKIKSADFTGVLFKENNFAGWQAFADNKKIKIYPVGLDFIYVRVPKGTKEVKLNYQGDFTSWFLFFLSMLTLIFYFSSLTCGQQVWEKLKLKIGLNNQIKKWWGKDDDQ